MVTRASGHSLARQALFSSFFCFFLGKVWSKNAASLDRHEARSWHGETVREGFLRPSGTEAAVLVKGDGKQVNGPTRTQTPCQS